MENENKENPKPLAIVDLQPSTRKHKRYSVKFLMSNGKYKTSHFGDNRYKTYIDTHDKMQRTRYWTRHFKDFETMDITRPGYLSAMILWGNSTNLLENVRIFKLLFDLK